MQKLIEKQLVPVFMTMRPNEERLFNAPPLLRNEINSDALRQAIERSVSDAAKSWDMYRDIVQLSFLCEGCAHHFLMCDSIQTDMLVTPELECTKARIVKVYDDEKTLVEDVVALIHDMYGSMHDGSVSYQRMMVGWRMAGEIWPVIVNRAIRYGIQLPSDMLAGPDVKWASGHFTGDIANIYMQGGTGQRSLPGLADVLRFWGFWPEHHTLLPEDIGQAVCDAPLATAKSVELYLHAMHAMLCRYYNIDTKPKPTSTSVIPTMSQLTY